MGNCVATDRAAGLCQHSADTWFEGGILHGSILQLFFWRVLHLVEGYIGHYYLGPVHINSSKAELGSGKVRHLTDSVGIMSSAMPCLCVW